MANRDYYELLGVARTANETEIKQAFRRLAKQYHPDRNKDNPQAEARFKEIQAAYAVLSDKEKRTRYDQFGHAGVDPGAQPGGQAWRWSTAQGQSFDFKDIADLFNVESFGGAGSPGGASVFDQVFSRRASGRGRRARARTGEDFEQPISLTFEQAVRGTTLDLELHGPARRERIAVRIPPGVHEGQRIRVRGKGQPGDRGSSAGDLYVVCSIQPHSYFHRRDEDVYLDVPITIAEASLGAKVDVPTLDGTRTVTIPPSTASGTKLRLAGLGVPKLRGGGRGDQYVVIKIVPPRRLTERQRVLLSELAELNDPSPRESLW